MITGIVDFHVHSAPSLVPRHHDDTELAALADSAGITSLVLKAHEGSTAERAALIGEVAVGSIALNSPVGGANPDAVEVAARLGARVVWMPTNSAHAHQAAAQHPDLSAHDGVNFRTVPVCDDDGALLPEWYDVIDVVAHHDMVLASGHISADEAITVFTAARARGVTRMVVTHPLLSFLGWRPEHAEAFLELGAYLEIGVLADLLGGPPDELVATTQLSSVYPRALLVFGSDLGHRLYPGIKPGVGAWVERALPVVGERDLERVLSVNGREVLEA